MYSGEWRLASEQSEVDDMLSQIKGEVEKRQEDAKRIAELEAEVKSLRDQISTISALRTKLSNIGLIKKVAQPSVVNKFGIPNPFKLKTN